MNRLAILDIAASELGVTEIIGQTHEERILEYQCTTKLAAENDETPWCAAFVNWVLKQAGYKGTGLATARSFLHWGEQPERPIVGCIVIFKRGKLPWQGHVGFYLGKDAQGNILCLGGNQTNKVCVATYPKDSVLGYRINKS